MEQLYQLFGREAEDFLHPKMRQESKIMDLPMARQRSNGAYWGDVATMFERRVTILSSDTIRFRTKTYLFRLAYLPLEFIRCYLCSSVLYQMCCWMSGCFVNVL